MGGIQTLNMARPANSEFDHWLKGSKSRAGERVRHHDEPAAKAGRPHMPADLPPEGQSQWKRVVRLLSQRKTITRADEMLLEVHCWTYLRWKRCVKQLVEQGDVKTSHWYDSQGHECEKEIEAPLSKVVYKLETSLRAQLRELGSTPLQREKVKPAKQPEPRVRELTPEEQEEQRFDELILKRR
jgi:P27 family predicted phage terminase small subunit